jgi:hypothetical protein
MKKRAKKKRRTGIFSDFFMTRKGAKFALKSGPI